MLDKVVESFDKAVEDIDDGSTCMMFCWISTGTPCNLIRALYNKGSKDLTIISHNFVPGFIGIGGDVHVLSQDEYSTPFLLQDQVSQLITAWPSPAIVGMDSTLNLENVKIEITGHGTLVERIRAGGSGIGGFYTAVGIGTVFEEGKEKRTVDGKEYILEKPLKADFGFVRAYKADKSGNLVYRVSERGCNPVLAMASIITIAEVDEVVEVGELDPESIVTPGIFIDRIVKIPHGGMGSRIYMKKLIQEKIGSEKKA